MDNLFFEHAILEKYFIHNNEDEVTCGELL